MGQVVILLSDLETQNPNQGQFKVDQGLAEKRTKDNYGMLNISWEFLECGQYGCPILNPSASKSQIKMFKPNFAHELSPLRPPPATMVSPIPTLSFQIFHTKSTCSSSSTKPGLTTIHQK